MSVGCFSHVAVSLPTARQVWQTLIEWEKVIKSSQSSLSSVLPRDQFWLLPSRGDICYGATCGLRTVLTEQEQWCDDGKGMEAAQLTENVNVWWEERRLPLLRCVPDMSQSRKFRLPNDKNAMAQPLKSESQVGNSAFSTPKFLRCSYLTSRQHGSLHCKHFIALNLKCSQSSKHTSNLIFDT